MKTLPKVRFVRGWQQYVPGNVIQPPAMLRGFLLDRKFVELVIEDAPAPEVVADADPNASTTDAAPPIRKRGRPRKDS